MVAAHYQHVSLFPRGARPQVALGHTCNGTDQSSVHFGTGLMILRGRSTRACPQLGASGATETSVHGMPPDIALCYCSGRRAVTRKIVAGNRMGPERASLVNAAAISSAINRRIGSDGFFSSINLAVGPIVSACRASSSGLLPVMVGCAVWTVI